MSVSPFNRPININICKGEGTIFSTPTSSGGGSGPVLSFTNLGLSGARVYSQTIFNNVQFRRLKQGVIGNTIITENSGDITIDTPELKFDSTAPIKRQINGLAGVVLGKQGIVATLQALLYPTLAPVISLALSPSTFEFGDNTDLAANWIVTKNDETILQITVGGGNITPITGNSQSGTKPINKNGGSNVTVQMQVVTNSTQANTSAIAVVSRKVRYGFTTKDGTIAQILDSDINALSNVFTTTGKLPLVGLIVPVSQYLIFVTPVTFGVTIPIFKVNGFVTNAFTKVRSNSAFVNSFGFSDPVDVWVSTSFSTGNIQFEID